MLKKFSAVMLILTVYMISIFIFEFMTKDFSCSEGIKEWVLQDGYIFSIMFLPYFIGGFCHFFLTIIIALIIGFNKKVSNYIKCTVCILPLLTFYLLIPTVIITTFF